jgi:hypothetical protein
LGVPFHQTLWVFCKLSFASNRRLNLQNQVSGFSQSFGFGKVRSFRSGYLPSLAFSKIGVCLFLGKFLLRFCQVSKIGFMVFVKVLASKPFHLPKFVFTARFIFGKVGFLKSASRFSIKVSVNRLRAFWLAHFFWQRFGLAKSFFQQAFW